MKRAQRKAIEERLKVMSRASEQGVTPEAVVNEAKNPRSPLHAAFPAKAWQDTWAAHQYRLQFARQLISSFQYEVTETDAGYVDFRAPMFVHNPKNGPGQQGYVELSSIRKRSGTARELLQEEMARLGAIAARARAIGEELNLTDYFDALLSEIAALNERVEAAAA